VIRDKGLREDMEYTLIIIEEGMIKNG